MRGAWRGLGPRGELLGSEPSAAEGWIRDNLTPIAELVTGSRRVRRMVGAVEANARLSATLGMVLLVLLAAEGASLVVIHRFLVIHIFLGLLLVPVVLLKLASVLRRFGGYYLGDLRYRAAGPPAALLRLLGPVVVVLTAILFATGVELWLFGYRYGSVWLTLHQGSFVLWFCAMAVHVVGHMADGPILAARDAAGQPAVPGRERRRAWVAASVAMGLALAMGGLLYASPFPAVIGH